ncbi:hypothetical protein EG327_010126 [Venturia inaequalis]|uniref:Uncharacterized protein n=1 Tax=Venturia inaequalis TaxID=5025 RepID=A0A8H3YT21_VENIN|nr:hypothetical protein EG327_010126 [Venturia inaequalis]
MHMHGLKQLLVLALAGSGLACQCTANGVKGATADLQATETMCELAGGHVVNPGSRSAQGVSGSVLMLMGRSILLATWAIVMTTIFEVLVLWVVPFSNIAVLGTQRVFSAFMYSGFSWVLYSRLHLVIQSSKILRIIFWTIVATGVSCNLPGILDICIPSLMRNPKLFEIFSGTDIVFSVQEIVLSSVYIYFFYQFARGGSLEPRDRATLTLLVIAQMVIILSDAATTVLIYIHFYILRMALLPFTYAVKLRLDLNVERSTHGPQPPAIE